MNGHDGWYAAAAARTAESGEMRFDDFHQRFGKLDVVGERIDHRHLARIDRIEARIDHVRRVHQRAR